SSPRTTPRTSLEPSSP
ncbi:hypothetical protein STRIP9103_09726, partial [Streptomyces ipomoeae 91-03]